MKKCIISVLTFFFIQVTLSLAYGSAGNWDGRVNNDTGNSPPVECIDWIGGNQLVIGDTAYLKTRATLYYDSRGKRTGADNRFQVGSCVRVVADAEYRIVALYESVQKKGMGAGSRRDNASGAKHSPVNHGSGVRRENGVWKN